MEIKSVSVNEIVVKERLRDINQDKVKDIALSVMEVGLINPITISSDNVLISGNHRLSAHKLLGYENIDCIISNVDRDFHRIIEIDENIKRLELNDIELGEHLLERDKILDTLGLRARQGDNRFTLNRQETGACLKTNKDISNELNIGERSLKLKKQIAKNLSYYSKSLLKPSIFSNNTKGLLILSRFNPYQQKEIVDILFNQNLKEIKEAINIWKMECNRKKLLNDTCDNDLRENVILYNKHFQECFEIKDKSIDLIFTDAPYMEKDIYKDIGIFSNRVLKNGASLFVYCFQDRMLEIMNDYLSIGLKYYWTICLKLNGSKTRHGKGIFISWKPILWFHKGDKINNGNKEFITDLIESEMDKTYHSWQQSTLESDYIIKHISKPGDTILDCCMGTGTTGISCLNQNRRFIGIEKDFETFSVARGRLSKKH